MRAPFDKDIVVLYHSGMRNLVSSILGLWIGAAAVLTAAEAPKTFKVGEFTFATPAKWQWVEVASAMRKAQFKIEDTAKKEGAEVVFFYFGEGGGGSTQANIDRWLAQFSEPKEKLNSKVESVTVGGRKIAAGSSLLVSPFLTHRDPLHWERPDEFDPERFRPEAVAARHRLSYIPFGAGGRMCIGNHFAMMEGMLAAVMLLQRFRAKLVPGQTVVPAAASTLKPKGGLKIVSLPIQWMFTRSAKATISV